ncbi:MAG: hypothetical protein G8345_14105 [Magnetococcales bacterium]|nr:hypothetical protein [Magnetococcales bacterium]NGZ28010.1 hypothetical protein [Magnetococcales bacterium]
MNMKRFSPRQMLSMIATVLLAGSVGFLSGTAWAEIIIKPKKPVLTEDSSPLNINLGMKDPPTGIVIKCKSGYSLDTSKFGQYEVIATDARAKTWDNNTESINATVDASPGETRTYTFYCRPNQ